MEYSEFPKQHRTEILKSDGVFAPNEQYVISTEHNTKFFGVGATVIPDVKQFPSFWAILKVFTVGGSPFETSVTMAHYSWSSCWERPRANMVSVRHEKDDKD